MALLYVKLEVDGPWSSGCDSQLYNDQLGMRAANTADMPV